MSDGQDGFVPLHFPRKQETMVRIFDRYFSIRNSLYFIFENIVVLIFLLWGTAFGSAAIGSAWLYMMAVVFVSRICLYYGELRLPFPRFFLKEVLFKHIQAILLAIFILFIFYLITPAALALLLSRYGVLFGCGWCCFHFC